MPRAMLVSRSLQWPAPRRAGASLRFLCLGLLLSSLLMNSVPNLWAQESSPVASPVMVLEDEQGPIGQLEAGHSLYVSGHGFPSQDLLEITLYDEAGTAISTGVAETDTGGVLSRFHLWRATGIVGCDCHAGKGQFKFARFEDAMATLAGRTFTVEVQSQTGGVLVKSLPMAGPTKKVGFPADLGGCPRFRFADDEDIYLRIWGGTDGETLGAQLVAGGAAVPIGDDSSPAPGFFSLSGSSTAVLLWPGDMTYTGGFSLFVSGSGWPFDVPILIEPHLNSGLVVLDHSCPPPPPGGG